MGAKIQADEISSIIKERIDNFELNVDVNETGKIISYADGIAQVYGLRMLWLVRWLSLRTVKKVWLQT